MRVGSLVLLFGWTPLTLYGVHSRQLDRTRTLNGVDTEAEVDDLR